MLRVFCRVSLLSLSLAISSPFSSFAQTADSVYSPAELREMGKEALAAAIEENGRDSNPRWRRDVALVIDSIRKAAAYHTFPVTFEIIGDSSLNAAAVPGGGMIVNVGLPLFCSEYAAPLKLATARNRRYMGCLAAVIGHEFAHLALGHTDSIGSMISRREQIGERMDAAGSLSHAVNDKVLMQALHFERGHELAADSTGALFALRAGWEIQDAIDLFIASDSVERGSSRWHDQLTWLLDHPRSSERAALLESFRARLKLDQRDFDDALVLIEQETMTDSAIAMLDRVLKDFPRLPAALHARAAALAQRWIGESDVQQLKVRASMPTYDARFITHIKGENPEPLRNARAAFQAAFEIDPHPYTLSDLAVLDAYSGDTAVALRRARLAAQRVPDNADVQNNLGVVLFISGHLAEARKAFDHAEQLAGDDLTSAIAFNVARAAAATGDTARALELIARYLRGDRESSWGRELLALRTRLGGGTTVSSTAPDAPSGSAPPPTVAGVKLGARAQDVIAAIGKPDSTEGNGAAVIWHYPSRQMILVVDEEDGVLVILVNGKAGGPIEGVSVGDALPAALRKLGTPTESGATEDGNDVLVFERGDWRIALIATKGIVTEISIRTASA